MSGFIRSCCHVVFTDAPLVDKTCSVCGQVGDTVAFKTEDQNSHDVIKAAITRLDLVRKAIQNRCNSYEIVKHLITTQNTEDETKNVVIITCIEILYKSLIDALKLRDVACVLDKIIHNHIIVDDNVVEFITWRYFDIRPEIIISELQYKLFLNLKNGDVLFLEEYKKHVESLDVTPVEYLDETLNTCLATLKELGLLLLG